MIFVETCKESGLVFTLRQIFLRSWVNVLLVFVPLGIVAEKTGFAPIVTFSLNALAIIPLTGLLTYATENAASKLGVGLGALLNITFGNLVELIIFTSFMLREGHIRLVLASLLGSIFVNLLFILGIAIMSGGYRHREQLYNRKATQMLACFMNMGVLCLLIPTSLHACIKKVKQADHLTLKFSRGISVVVLLVYAVYIHVLLKSPPQQISNKTLFDHEAQTSTRPSKVDADEVRPIYTPNGGISYTPPEQITETSISKRSSIILLVISAGFISVCAEFLVDSIEHVVANARLTEAFLGLIILPLLGNTAELGTAVTVAIKNKMDLAINVTVGSAIQITLFMAPAMVALGWATGKDMSLEFDMFQTVALLITLVMVNFMLLSGRCNCLFGLLLFACYVIIGIGAYDFPNQHKKDG
ncbi:calcium/proton exchanger [Tothia fuscella]|uniref:Vacuolar calcium ion transporter n=1 Tax=Tothia fuscella TaxID=1048955 RepID=A0A9P4NL09_9PEZI|nr:calcium/proton exchanger [Tothia fuscella]